MRIREKAELKKLIVEILKEYGMVPVTQRCDYCYGVGYGNEELIHKTDIVQPDIRCRRDVKYWRKMEKKTKKK